MKGGEGGKFSESTAGCTAWKDVNKETFERFIQFAYTGDYSIPGPGIRVKKTLNIPSGSSGPYTNSSEDEAPMEEIPAPDYPEEPVEAEEPTVEEPTMEEPVVEEEDFWRFSTSKKGKKKRKTVENHSTWNAPPFTDNFRRLEYQLRAPRNTYADDCEPSRIFNNSFSYSNVFLSHAALYVLGDLWLIDSLKALALFKLHKTLCVFELDDTNVEDILDLARYAYLDEGKGSEEGIGDLRNMVCQYIASNVVVLTTDKGFIDLLGGGGQFVKDVWGFVVQRH